MFPRATVLEVRSRPSVHADVGVLPGSGGQRGHLGTAQSLAQLGPPGTGIARSHFRSPQSWGLDPLCLFCDLSQLIGADLLCPA